MTEEKKGLNIATIGIYAGCVIMAVLIIFVLIMCVEKLRKKNKRITEVVELKPVDIDKHFQGIQERNRAAKNKMQRPSLKKP